MKTTHGIASAPQGGRPKVIKDIYGVAPEGTESSTAASEGQHVKMGAEVAEEGDAEEEDKDLEVNTPHVLVARLPSP